MAHPKGFEPLTARFVAEYCYPAELRVRSDVLLSLTILTDRVDLKWRTREDSNL